jgi:hypothetical protein
LGVGGLMKSAIPTPVADQDFNVTYYGSVSKKVRLDNRIMMTTIVIVIIYLMPVNVFGVIVYAQVEDLKHKMLTTGKINESLKDENGNKIWILSGNWNSNLFSNTKFNHTNPAKFSATINMVMTNGSSPHKHKVSHFTLTNMSTQNNSTMYEGYLSVSMKLGPVFAIPVIIRNFQNETISISLESLEGITSDQMNVINHFESKPISGTFAK